MAIRKRREPSSHASQGQTREARPAIDRIESALRDLKFGHVTVFVQDGVVVLIERTEKTRVV